MASETEALKSLEGEIQREMSPEPEVLKSPEKSPEEEIPEPEGFKSLEEEIQKQSSPKKPTMSPKAEAVEENVPEKNGGNWRKQNGTEKKRQTRNSSKTTKRRRVGKKLNNSGHLMFEDKEFPLLEYTDYLQAKMEVEAHFNKKFSFTKPSEDSDNAWKLPPADTMYTKDIWEDEDLQATKKLLNQVKEQLRDKDIAPWHQHTKNINPTEKLVFECKRRVNAEMITQAWCKFYEIANAYPIVPPCDEDGLPEVESAKEVPFNSVHLCEAPGAFITALNHYLVSNRPLFKWQWLGNTLNPYYEGSPSETCVVVDKLIYHTLQNWTFGTNNMGDIMERETLDDIINRANGMGPISLVTADGSIDCQASPGEQELTTHKLHLCEVISALSILAPGGSLVIKKFTMFESPTLNLMYLLCCVFKEVKVFKPGTSKEGNSEAYVVCLDYNGKDECRDYIDKLVDKYGSFIDDKAMFGREDLPKDFLLQIKKCTEIFKAYQVKTIVKNISLYEKMTEKDKQYIELLKFKSIRMFFEVNICKRLIPEQMLTGDKVNRSRYLMETDLNKPVTSTFVRSTCPREKLNFAKEYMDKYIEEFGKRRWNTETWEEYNSSKFPSLDLENIKIDVVRGKPYTRIKNSKFCSPKVLEAFRTLYMLYEDCNCDISLNLDCSILERVKKEHPNVLVLQSKLLSDPVYDLGALLEVLTMIKDKKVNEGDSLILFNVTLLSRLQGSLLALLNCAFHNIVVYSSPKIGTEAPVILFENFRSMEQGEAIMKVVENTGWNPFDGDPDVASEVLQLVSFSQLLERDHLCALYHYNLQHCIHRAIRLQDSLNSVLD